MLPNDYMIRQAAQRAEDAQTAATTQERDMAQRTQHELDAEARENRYPHCSVTQSECARLLIEGRTDL